MIYSTLANMANLPIMFDLVKQLSTERLERVQVSYRNMNHISPTSSITIYLFCTMLKLVRSASYCSVQMS